MIGTFNMSPTGNPSERLQAYSQTSLSSGGCRPADQQELLGRPAIIGNQPGSNSTPNSVNITDRSGSISTIYDFKSDFTGKTYKVVTEQFTYQDGSPGLRLNKTNGKLFMECSSPFNLFTPYKRTYTDPDTDEDKHIKTLMIISESIENQGCLKFLTRNNIVKVVGFFKSHSDIFPIVQLLLKRETNFSGTQGSTDSLPAYRQTVNYVEDPDRLLKLIDPFLTDNMFTKSVMSETQIILLSKYIVQPDQTNLDSLQDSTFRYIAKYLNSGQQDPRLKIACRDFGYTLQELKQFRHDRISPVHVACAVISRK